MVQTRRVRSTGGLVSVGLADEFGLDADGGASKWYTVCDVHGSCVGHSSRRLAVSWSSVPADWCEFCAGVSVWCAVCANSAEWCDHEG
jgi:hypothetical protein